LLAVGTVGSGGATRLGRVTWATFGLSVGGLRVFLGGLLRNVLRLLRCLLLWGLSDWSVMRRVNIVIDISIIISDSRLLRGESPFIVNNELIFVNAPLKGLEKSKFIAILLHGNSFSPLVKAAYQKHLLSSEVPREHDVDQVLLWRLWEQLLLGILH
jgi:hypothetical protein